MTSYRAVWSLSCQMDPSASIHVLSVKHGSKRAGQREQQEHDACMPQHRVQQSTAACAAVPTRDHCVSELRLLQTALQRMAQQLYYSCLSCLLLVGSSTDLTDFSAYECVCVVLLGHVASRHADICIVGCTARGCFRRLHGKPATECTRMNKLKKRQMRVS